MGQNVSENNTLKRATTLSVKRFSSENIRYLLKIFLFSVLLVSHYVMFLSKNIFVEGLLQGNIDLCDL